MAEPDSNDRQPAIPQQLVIDVMNKSDGEMCWRYNGLGRGWYGRFNAETKYYEVAVSANVPETTDDGHVMVRVETKQHWYFGRMDLEEWFPEFFTSNRLEPVALEKTPFTGLEDPEPAPKEVYSQTEGTMNQYNPMGYVRAITGGAPSDIWHPYQDCEKLENADTVHEYQARSLARVKQMCKSCSGESRENEGHPGSGHYQSLVEAAKGA